MGVQSHAMVNPESLTVPCYKVSSFCVENEPKGFWQRLKFFLKPWKLTVKYEVIIPELVSETNDGVYPGVVPTFNMKK